MSLRNWYSNKRLSEWKSKASRVNVWEWGVQKEQRASTKGLNQECVQCAGLGTRFRLEANSGPACIGFFRLWLGFRNLSVLVEKVGNDVIQYTLWEDHSGCWVDRRGRGEEAGRLVRRLLQWPSGGLVMAGHVGSSSEDRRCPKKSVNGGSVQGKTEEGAHFWRGI